MKAGQRPEPIADFRRDAGPSHDDSAQCRLEMIRCAHIIEDGTDEGMHRGIFGPAVVGDVRAASANGYPQIQMPRHSQTRQIRLGSTAPREHTNGAFRSATHHIRHHGPVSYPCYNAVSGIQHTFGPQHDPPEQARKIDIVAGI